MTEYQRRQKRRREFSVRFGVYLAVLVGVIGQSVVSSVDPATLDIELALDGWEWSKLIVGAGLAAMLYWRLDGQGDLAGKTKNTRNVIRALVLGFAAGWAVVDSLGLVANVVARSVG